MNHPLTLREPVTIILLGMAATFALLGLFFVAAPGPGGAFFGFPATSPDGQFYVRAIGFRDAAVALYLLLLTLGASRRAVFLMLVATPVIPIGDLALLWSSVGWTRHMLPHLFSGVCFASVAWWVRRSAR